MIGSWSFKRLSPEEISVRRRRKALEENADLLSCCPGNHTRAAECMLRPMKGEVGYVPD